MLLTLLLMIFVVTGARALPPANTIVSINAKQTPAVEIIAAIQKQSGLNIIYRSEITKNWPKLTLKDKKPASEVLEDVADLISCNVTIKGNIATLTPKKLSGKMRTCKGCVRDENGEPLAGVPICIGETRVCTVTDANGNYSFPIPCEKTVLKYSYVGMDTRYLAVPAGNTTVNHDITLSSSNMLQEVVATGYQDISRPKMTGSATVVGAEKLNDRFTTDLTSNLEGRVAGLSTYGDKLTIRGTSSLYASSNPLIVIDGVPVESELKDINPNDVETITVLKDAAATAIYGARATNGIIVITTKNAKKQNKIEIDFTGNLSITGKKDISYADNWYMSPAEQVAMESDYWKGYFGNSYSEVADPIGSATSYRMYGAMNQLHELYY